MDASDDRKSEDREDWFLQTLVSIANRFKEEVGFGITLFVGGALVSGILVGGRHYFLGFAEEFAAGAAEDDVKANLEESIGSLTRIYDEPDAAGADDEMEHLDPPRYIHLKDARVYAAGSEPVPGNRGVWWRGRLDAVDGFVLGQLSTVKD
jgi:hypothetical protein